jgi:hypothetical protein
MEPVPQRKVWPPLPDSPEAQGESRGLECRRCGCRHFFVDNTRKASRMIIRYRRCRNCGQRVTTCERPISPDR